MKIRMPKKIREMNEVQQLLYCDVYRAGYLTLARPALASALVHIRDDWPEAWDAGSKYALSKLTRAGTP